MPGFYQRFLESVARWPDNVAIELQKQEGEPERLTYSDLRSQAEAVGAWLQKQSGPGAFQGVRCAILADNGPRWVAAYLGAIAAGGVAVPLDTAFSSAQVAKLLRDSGSAYLFANARHLSAARKAVEEAEKSGARTRLVLLDDAPNSGIPAWKELQAHAGRSFAAAQVSPEDLAVILYTSGTTSDPKGVMLTHDNLQGEADSVFKFLRVGPRDSILGILPLFHALAQMANLLLPFAAGARVVYLETLNTTELLRGLRECEITLFACVPQFFYLIHERIMKQVAGRPWLQRASFAFLKRLSAILRPVGINAGKLFFRPVHTLLGKRIRYLITGGSRFDAAIGRDFQHLGFNILQAYGLTETSGGASATPPGENVVGSVGKPLPDVEMKIVPAQTAGDEPGVGEVAIKGRIVMKGYYNRPDATAEVLKNGWLHTGDLGYFDAGGNLFITGRQKEIIVLSSGKNIYPEEIEAHYQQSPFIKEMCVVGLESKPGEPFSERLHGVIVPNFEILRERKIVNASQVIRFDIETLSAQFPSTKRILSYEIWQDDLPRTTTRKLKRFEILRKVLDKQAAGETTSPEQIGTRQLTPEAQGWLDEPQHARAVAVIRRAAKTKKDSIHPDDNLELDLGLDSMERVELLVEVEQEFDSHVPDSVAANVYTVRELVEAAISGAGSGGGRRAAGWESVLAEEVDDREVLAVAQRRPISEAFWFLASRLAYVILRLFFRMSVYGREKLPKKGPFIISPNHQSFLDAPALATTLPWHVMRDIFSVGTSEIFGTGLWRQAARWWRLIPIDPDANLVPAMRAGAYGLKQGKILLLFPEGERSIDGTPKVFRKGAGILAAHLRVPIVPVALEGFHEAWPRGRRFQRFAKLYIEFGDPIQPPEAASNSEELYQQITSELRQRVVEKWSRLHGERGMAASAAD